MPVFAGNRPETLADRSGDPASTWAGRQKSLVHLELDPEVFMLIERTPQMRDEPIRRAAERIVTSHPKPRLDRLQCALPTFAKHAFSGPRGVVKKPHVGRSNLPADSGRKAMYADVQDLVTAVGSLPDPPLHGVAMRKVMCLQERCPFRWGQHAGKLREEVRMAERSVQVHQKSRHGTCVKRGRECLLQRLRELESSVVAAPVASKGPAGGVSSEERLVGLWDTGSTMLAGQYEGTLLHD